MKIEIKVIKKGEKILHEEAEHLGTLIDKKFFIGNQRVRIRTEEFEVQLIYKESTTK